MKTLADGIEVTPRMYYYLLAFNEMTDREFIRNTFQKNALNELTITEFLQLFQHATSSDVEYLRYKDVEVLLGLMTEDRLSNLKTTDVVARINDRVKELNISDVINSFDSLTDEQRVEIMDRYDKNVGCKIETCR